MRKQTCGQCRWFALTDNGEDDIPEDFGECLAPLPMSITVDSTDDVTGDQDATNCDVFTPAKNKKFKK